MKRHVSLTLLVLTTLGVLNAHVDLAEVDGRRFVAAQGRLHDPLGWLEDGWTRLARRCSPVQAVPASEDVHGQALAAVQAFSPPDSASARLVQLNAQGSWLLAEVEFDRLNPAVVLLVQDGSGPRVVGEAIWSGSTEPWRPAPRIRAHLAQRAPQAPAALLACLEPKQRLFQPR
jgi:hypothetical protein